MMSGSMYDMSGTPDMFQSFIEQNAGRAYETYNDSSEVFGSVNFSIYYAILAAFLALNAILVFSIAFTDKNFKENSLKGMEENTKKKIEAEINAGNAELYLYKMEPKLGPNMKANVASAEICPKCFVRSLLLLLSSVNIPVEIVIVCFTNPTRTLDPNSSQ